MGTCDRYVLTTLRYLDKDLKGQEPNIFVRTLNPAPIAELISRRKGVSRNAASISSSLFCLGCASRSSFRDYPKIPLPQLIRMSIAVKQLMAIEALDNQLRDAIVAARSQVSGPAQICAWAKFRTV